MNELARRRLFFALWPDDECQLALSRLAKRSLPRKGGRLIPAEKIHLTLAFLGPVTSEVQECVERVAGDLRGPTFSLVLERIGHWPRPRVLWSAPTETPEELSGLVTGLRKGLLGCGFEPEARPFRAHLTLARKVSRRIPETAHEPIVWSVDNFHLVESKTLPEGARYQVLKSWPLRV